MIVMIDVGEVYFMLCLIEVCVEVVLGVSLLIVCVGVIDLKSEMEVGWVDLVIGVFDNLLEVLY